MVTAHTYMHTMLNYPYKILYYPFPFQQRPLIYPQKTYNENEIHGIKHRNSHLKKTCKKVFRKKEAISTFLGNRAFLYIYRIFVPLSNIGAQ